MLIEKTDLDLMDVIALDKVQKGTRLAEEEFKSLKSQELVEGRRPNLYVSAKIAVLTGDKATYIKHRAFDKDHYKRMVTSYLEKFGEAKRGDIDKLLLAKISDALTEEQRRNWITNLLQEMSKKDGTIRTEGTTKAAKWILSKTEREGPS